MRTSSTRIAILLVVLALLPALLYTGIELNSLSENEQLLTDVYNRQLDAVLFSVNQYAWDVVNSWASSVEQMLGEAPLTSPDSSALHAFVRRNAALRGVFTADSALSEVRLLGVEEGDTLTQEVLPNALAKYSAVAERLVRYRKSEYRKIEPALVGGGELALMFGTGSNSPHSMLAGVLLNEREFVRSIIGKKLQDVAGEEFVLAVLAGDSIIYTTGSTTIPQMQQMKALWLFPDQNLGIRLKGASVAELVQARARRNILLVLILDVVLVAAAWYVYRTIRREMDLVRMKGDFVSNVSHELRTPLALIRMFGETLEMGRVKSDQKRQEYYRTIVKESERLTRLVNNILDFSKMEAGKKQYHFKETDINHVVTAVMETYSYHLKSKGFVPQISLAENLPSINADAEAVTEAVINLVDNGMKYSGEATYLRVATKATDKIVVVEVEDHGVGIAAADQKKIFDTFYRVSSGLVHNTKGSGLGLTLVKHIMEAHKGSVEVESVPGNGSTFRLLFPINSSHSS